MKPLTVLITTSYYWPEGAGSAPYLTGLAEHLSAQGHRVVVGTTFPHYPDWQMHANGRLARSERRAGALVRRRWAYVPRRQSAAQRALYEASLYALGLTALPMSDAPDVVIGTSPSLAGGLLAATAGKLYRVPYGLVIQDVMGLAAAQSGIAGGDRVADTVKRVELGVARGATRVAIIAEGFRAYYEDGGVDPARIVRLRNWTRRTPPSESAEETRIRFGWSATELVCVHGGNMGLKQGLDNLLDAAALLREEDVRIVLAGDGSDRERLQRRARALRLDNVQFVELQGPGRWEEIMQASDVLLVNQRPSVADMSLPSKLTSYFAAGRPVVAAASPGSETAREIDDAGAGYVISPDDPAAFREAILALRRDRSRTEELGRSAEHYAARHLSPDVALAQYDRFVAELTGR